MSPTSEKERAEAEVAARLHQARVAALLGEGFLDPGEDDLTSLLARTAEVFQHSIAEETRQTYARRWRLFTGWCEKHRLCPLPADPETVMLYLTETAGDGVALGTLRGWMAALNRVHVEAGAPPPGAHPAMGLFLRGLSRLAPAGRTVNVAALRIAQLRQVCLMLDEAGTSMAQARDRAVLVLHRAGLSDGAISRLRWEDLVLGEHRARVRVESPRTGVPGRVVVLRSRRDITRCPVAALRDWADVTGSAAGPVFVGVEPARAQAPALTPKSVYSLRHARMDALGGQDGVDGVIAALALAPAEIARDKAALLVGFAGAFRRVDLVRLRWRDVRLVDGGAVLHLVRSKTDRHGLGRDVGIPRGTSALTCPVTALEAWRVRYQAAYGGESIDDCPVFVRIGRSGRLSTNALTPEALTYLVKRRAEQAGLDGRWGGRSLRAGFISTAADLDIPLEQIARQSRHATLDTLMLYIRQDDLFRRNSAAKVGL